MSSVLVNAKEVLQKLNLFKQKLPERTREGMEKVCLKVEADSKKNCPPSITGNLRAIITHKVVDEEDGEIAGYVGSNLDYLIRSNIDPALIAIPAPMVLVLRTGILFCSNISFSIAPGIGAVSIRKQVSSGKGARTFLLPQTGQRGDSWNKVLQLGQYMIITRLPSHQYHPALSAFYYKQFLEPPRL